MNYIYWDDSLSVGIGSMDDQHKKLVDLINDLYDNLSSSADNGLIIRLVSGMKTYTVHHFSTEEFYMRRLNYPGYEEHVKEHQFFIEKVDTLEENLHKDTVTISLEITGFIKEWIRNHILQTDKKYTDFFRKHGIS